MPDYLPLPSNQQSEQSTEQVADLNGPFAVAFETERDLSNVVQDDVVDMKTTKLTPLDILADFVAVVFTGP